MTTGAWGSSWSLSWDDTWNVAVVSPWGQSWDGSWGNSWNAETEVSEFVGNVGEIVIDFDRWLALNKFPARKREAEEPKKQPKPDIVLPPVLAVAIQVMPSWGQVAEAHSNIPIQIDFTQPIEAFGQQAEAKLGPDYIGIDNDFMMFTEDSWPAIDDATTDEADRLIGRLLREAVKKRAA